MKKVFFAFAASAVVFLSQSVLASSFTANPLWTAPAKGSLNRDTADLTGGGFNLFAYEFTVTSNITVDALGTYVGVNDDGKSKASAKGISPLEPDSTDDWTNPGNPETVALVICGAFCATSTMAAHSGATTVQRNMIIVARRIACVSFIISFLLLAF